VSGYWQLPLHPDSYSACGVIKPRGVLISKRVLQGLANAVSFFQSSIEPLFSSLINSMKAWLDDFSLHAADENSLLDHLEEFLRVCQEKRLRLSARKCKLFRKELRWCGRIISGEGYTMDPTNLTGLQGMSMPKSAGELDH